MDKIDQRNRLDDEVFTYQVNKDHKVFIYWRGRQVRVLKGAEAQLVLDRIASLDAKGIQLVLAKATGNFKRGNER